MRAVAVIALSFGCLGEDAEQTTVVTPLTARQYFDDQVYPILRADCGGCHMSATGALGFLDPDATRAYDRIIASQIAGDFTASAPILNLRGHQGPGYTADQAQVILAWLAMELEGN